MWRHLTNSYVIDENHHQNNGLHQQLNVSAQFDGVETNFLNWHLDPIYVGILGRDL